MNITVLGYSHLGQVVAASLAEYFDVRIWDGSNRHIYDRSNDAPLLTLWSNAIDREMLAFWEPETERVGDIVWICIDAIITPNGVDVDDVFDRVWLTLNRAEPGTIVLMSSQLPAGTMKRFADKWPALRFACVPENIRVGRGVQDLRNSERICVGINDQTLREPIAEVLGKFTDNILFMSIESAEWVKHAVNGFLSLSVAFANSFGDIAQKQGVNLKEIERAMKTDSRIGQRAYVSYGGAPGDHLMRDTNFLAARGGGLFRAMQEAHERFEAKKLA